MPGKKKCEEKTITVLRGTEEEPEFVEIPLSEFFEILEDIYSYYEVLKVGDYKLWYRPDHVDLKDPIVQKAVNVFEKEFGQEKVQQGREDLRLSRDPYTGEVYITE